MSNNWTKGKWTFRKKEDDEAIIDVDGEYFAAICFPLRKHQKSIEANARLMAAAPQLLVVSHNLAETIGIDYAIKKLSTISNDNMAIGVAAILRGIQQQAKAVIEVAERKE